MWCVLGGVYAWDWTHSFFCLSWRQPLCFKTTIKVLFWQTQCALKYDGAKQMHLDYLLGMHCGKVSLWEYKGRGMGNRPTEGCTAHNEPVQSVLETSHKDFWIFFLGRSVGWMVGWSFCFETVSHTSPGWPELPTPWTTASPLASASWVLEWQAWGVPHPARVLSGFLTRGSREETRYK